MEKQSEPVLRAPIVAILIFEVAGLLARALLQVRLIDGGEPKPFAQDLSYLVVPPILLVLMYPILRQHGCYLMSLLRREDLTIRLAVLSILLGVTLRLSYWGGLISLVSFGVLRNSDPDAVVGPVISIACPEPQVLALSFLVVSFLIPITEEVINRGLILQSLMHRGKALAVLLSSALFAVMHDPQAIMITFLVGLFLAVQAISYKTLWATLITHATYNTAAVVDWDCISIYWNPVETTPSMIGGGLVAIGLTIGALLFSVVLAVTYEHRDA